MKKYSYLQKEQIQVYISSNIVILPLLKKDTKQIDETLNNLLVFAEEGLRYFNFFKIEL
jgi:microsomal dipeptidase-like Zn-dependent dipeptidase